MSVNLPVLPLLIVMCNINIRVLNIIWNSLLWSWQRTYCEI